MMVAQATVKRESKCRARQPTTRRRIMHGEEEQEIARQSRRRASQRQLRRSGTHLKMKRCCPCNLLKVNYLLDDEAVLLQCIVHELKTHLTMKRCFFRASCTNCASV